MAFKFLNLLFRIFLIFLICFVWTRYFIRSLPLALTYTALSTIIIEIIIHFFLQNKIRKTKLKKDEEELAEKITANFILSPNLALNFFCKLGKINYNVKKQSKFIILEKGNTKTVLFPAYSFSPFCEQDLVEIVKKIEKIRAKKLVICCKSFSKQTRDLSKKFSDYEIIILDSQDVFLKLIKPHNILPQDLKQIDFDKKTKFKEIISLAFSKQRIKGYLLSSIVLLLSSFFVKMNIFYVSISSLLLVLCLVCLLRPEKKATNYKNII